MSEPEVRKSLDSLRRIVAAVEGGELDASPSVLDQLRGSVVALEALLGDQDTTD